MKAAILAAVVLAFSVTQASAVSRAVKMACASDYFAHCSMHAVGSPGVRKCMRAVGPRLSPRCVSALVAAGEVSTSKIAKKKDHAKKYASKKSVAKKQVAEQRIAKTKVAGHRVSKKRYASKPIAKKRYTKKQFVKVAEG
jgi:hypothetical protein